MNPQSPPADFRSLARKAMLDAGFAPDFPPEVLSEASRAAAAVPGPPGVGAAVPDLRSLLWSSIDNRESRDLDQIEVVEPLPGGATKVLIGIADVDGLVPKGCATDLHAAQNTTSVYTGLLTFPMLPEAFSTGATSLLADVDRAAVIIEFTVDADGSAVGGTVYRAFVRNRAKLAYGAVGDWIEGHGPVPPEIAAVPGMEEQIRLQDGVSVRLEAQHERDGSLKFDSREASPVIRDGTPADLTIKPRNRARQLIENFMIAANGAMVSFLNARHSPSIRRVVRTPKRWDRIVEIAAGLGEQLPTTPDSRALSAFLTKRHTVDPAHFPDLSLAVVKLLGPGEYVASAGGDDEGHFGLAMHDYTHSTAPNRRYADVVTQRLVKAAMEGAPAPYALGALAEVAAHCTERESAAKKVTRTMQKVIAAQILSKHIGEIFDGIVTGASEKGTYVRLLRPPAEGRIVRGTQGLDVGDKVSVRLLSTDPARGFIDFERNPLPKSVGIR